MCVYACVHICLQAKGKRKKRIEEEERNMNKGNVNVQTFCTSIEGLNSIS